MSPRASFRRLVLTCCSLVVVGVALAAPASAHPHDDARLAGGIDGFLHPLLGLDHLAAMVAVGVVAVLAHRRLPIWALPATFVGAMIGGGAFGFAGLSVGGMELAIAASVLVLGLAIAVARSVKIEQLLVPVVGAAGAAHGLAHGLEAPAAASPLLYVAGFVVATAILHAAGAAGGLALRRVPIGQLATGVATTALGLVLVAGS